MLDQPENPTLSIRVLEQVGDHLVLLLLDQQRDKFAKVPSKDRVQLTCLVSVLVARQKLEKSVE